MDIRRRRQTSSLTAARRAALPASLMVALAATALLLAAPAAQAAPATRGAAASSRASTVSASYEARVVKSINNVRRRAGLPRLRLVPGLRRSARIHSLEMARKGYFDHYSPLSGLGPTDRIRRHFASGGFRYWAAGENLLWSSSAIAPWRVVVRWLRSPGHRAVLLSPEWRRVGVGVVRSRAGSGRPGLIVTADFAVRRR